MRDEGRVEKRRGEETRGERENFRVSRTAEEFRSAHQEQIPRRRAPVYEFLNEIYRPVDVPRNFPSRTLNNCELFMQLYHRYVLSLFSRGNFISRAASRLHRPGAASPSPIGRTQCIDPRVSDDTLSEAFEPLRSCGPIARACGI